jgi:hypothetical protein
MVISISNVDAFIFLIDHKVFQKHYYFQTSQPIANEKEFYWQKIVVEDMMSKSARYNTTWTLTSDKPLFDPGSLHLEQGDSLQTFIKLFQTTFLPGETGQSWTSAAHPTTSPP